MDNIIRLLPGQIKNCPFRHELLDNANDYKLESFDEATKNEMVLANMWLVRMIVGQYLYHWPMTEVWLDEMVSSGLAALMEAHNLKDPTVVGNAIKHRIESDLNNLRSLVRASLRTNRRRQEDGRELEYAVMENTLHNVGMEDSELSIADHLDSLEPEDLKFYLENRDGNS